MSEQKQNWEEEFDKKFVEEEICDSIIFVKILWKPGFFIQRRRYKRRRVIKFKVWIIFFF